MPETVDVRRSVGIAALVIGLGLLAMAAVALKTGRLKLRPGSPLKAGAPTLKAGAPTLKAGAPTLKSDAAGPARSTSVPAVRPPPPAAALAPRPTPPAPPPPPRPSFRTEPVLTELGAVTRAAWLNGKRGRLLAWEAEQRLRRLEREDRLPTRPPPRPSPELEAVLPISELRRLDDQELGRFLVEQIRSGRQGYALGESLAEQVRRQLQQRQSDESD